MQVHLVHKHAEGFGGVASLVLRIVNTNPLSEEVVSLFH